VTAEEFFQVRMNQKLKDHPESMNGFDCIYQFEVSGDAWSLDLKEGNRVITKGSHPSPDCTIALDQDSFEKLIERRLNPAVGIIMGKIKISGDKSLALKLGRLFA
jgi:putative sterol carrier protein